MKSSSNQIYFEVIDVETEMTKKLTLKRLQKRNNTEDILNCF